MKKLNLSLMVPEDGEVPGWSELREGIVRNFLEPMKQQVDKLDIGSVSWRFLNDPQFPIDISYRANFAGRKTIYDDGFSLLFYSRGGAVLSWDRYPDSKHIKGVPWFKVPRVRQRKQVTVSEAFSGIVALFEEAARVRTEEVKQAVAVADVLSRVSGMMATLQTQ